MNKNIQGHLFALTANILWGLMAPVGNLSIKDIDMSTALAKKSKARQDIVKMCIRDRCGT